MLTIPVKVSTQENNRSPSETQLDMPDLKRNLSKGKSFFLRALFLPGFPNEKMPLDICDEDFSFKNKPTEMKFSFKEESFLIKEIEKLLEKGEIREPIHVEGDFISPISPSDPFRLILNLK